MKKLLLIIFVFSLLLGCSSSSTYRTPEEQKQLREEAQQEILDAFKEESRSKNLNEEYDYEANRKREKDEMIKREESFKKAKIECEEIGFKKGTEKFGQCVLDLTN